MVKFASPSCVRFISFGFVLASTTCVWVWMVCSLHSVTTDSRDRVNVSFIIIIIIIIISKLLIITIKVLSHDKEETAIIMVHNTRKSDINLQKKAQTVSC